MPFNPSAVSGEALGVIVGSADGVALGVGDGCGFFFEHPVSIKQPTATQAMINFFIFKSLRGISMPLVDRRYTPDRMRIISKARLKNYPLFLSIS